MKKKVAFISEHASPLATLGGKDSGGQNVYVGELAIQIANKGYEVDIYTRREDHLIDRIVTYADGVRVIHMDAGPALPIAKEEILCYMDDFTQNMILFIEEEQLSYEILHANFWMSGLVAMKIKQKLNIPFVITFHALGHVRKIHQKEQDKFPVERLSIEEEIVQQADLIIAECPQDYDDLIEYYHADPEYISTVACGYNPKEFYPINKTASRKMLNLEAGEKVILQLGRMVPRKGVDNVIKALALMDTSGVKTRLIVVGGEFDDPNKDGEVIRLKQLAKSLNVENLIRFEGRKNRTELKYYYDAADVFITTPWYEPFGITPLEAMACGTPVIGSNVGGIKHTIIDGETGFLVPANQPEILSEQITALLGNESLLQKMSINALIHVKSKYTWKKIAEKMIECYETVMLRQTVISSSMLQPVVAEPIKMHKIKSNLLYTGTGASAQQNYGS